MSEKREHSFTQAELVFALLSGGLLGSIVAMVIGGQNIDIQILKAKLEYAETGDITELMHLKENAWDMFMNYGLLGSGLGMLIGVFLLQGINASRNAALSKSRKCKCPDHRTV